VDELTAGLGEKIFGLENARKEGGKARLQKIKF
jgi:hypothetical protein